MENTCPGLYISKTIFLDHNLTWRVGGLLKAISKEVYLYTVKIGNFRQILMSSLIRTLLFQKILPKEIVYLIRAIYVLFSFFLYGSLELNKQER